MKQLKKIMAFLLALILLIPLCACAGNSGDEDEDEYPFESVIDNYFDVAFKGKYNKVKKLAPEAFWEYMKEEMDMDADDYIDELEDNEYYETMMDFLEEEYGDNIRFAHKILEAEELSKKKLDTIRNRLKENYDIATKSVTEGYTVEVKVTVKGDDDQESNEDELDVVKIDGSWYIVTEAGTFNLGLRRYNKVVMHAHIFVQ